MDGGSLSGAGTVTATEVRNEGALVSPGNSAGTLIISGAYTQNAAGTLEIEIGGLSPGTQHDQLVVTGAASFAGNLDLTEISGFSPSNSDTFTVVTYASVVGDFANVSPTFGDVVSTTAGGTDFDVTVDDNTNFYTWVGTSGDFGTPANWQSPAGANIVPTAGDDAFIDPAGTETITVTGSEGVRKLQSTDDIDIDGGILTLDDTSSISGSLDLDNNGVLDIADELTVSGTFTFADATVSGAGGTLVTTGVTTLGTFGGDTMLLDDATWDNSGTATWADGNFVFGDEAADVSTFNNLSGGIFNIDNPGNTLDILVGDGAATINNEGNVVVGSSGPDSDIFPVFNNLSGGTVTINSSVLQLNADGAHSGTFSIGVSGELSFEAGTHVLDSSSDVTGSGLATTSGADVTVKGTYDAATEMNAGTLSFDSGAAITLASLEMAGGSFGGSDDIDVTGAFLWKQGTIEGDNVSTLTANGTSTLDTASTKTLDGRLLENNGTMTWSDGDVDLVAGGTLTNLATGTFNVQNPGNTLDFLASDGTGVFNNEGILVVNTAVAPDSDFFTEFNNDGAVTVTVGNLQLQGGGVHTGTFTATDTLDFAGGIHDLDDGALLTGGGTIDYSAGTLRAVGTGAGATLATGNALTIGTGLSLAGGGIFNNQGTLTINGGTLSAQVVNTSPVEFTGGTNTVTAGGGITSGAVDLLGGTTTFETGSTFSVATTTIDGGNVEFEIDGTTNTLVHSSSTLGGGGSLTVDTTWTPATGATVDGFLILDNTIVETLGAGEDVAGSGTIVNDGDLTLQGVTINPTVAGDGTVLVNSGTNTVDAFDLDASSSLSVQSGATLSVTNPSDVGSLTLGSGTLTGAGDVTIHDLLAWNAAGLMLAGGTTIVAQQGSMDISSASTRELRRVLQHDSITGSSVWRDNGRFDFLNGTLNNTGHLDITASAQMFDDGGTNLFDNTGLLTVNSTGTVQVESPFNNTGTMLGQSGAIDFEDNGVSPGDFTVSSAAAIDFAGGTHDLTDADLTGPGTIRFSGGTTTIDDGGGGAAFSVGTAQFTGGIANINIDADADTLILTTGTLTNNANTPTFTVNNQFDWNANATMSGTGITEVVPAASMDISSISTRDLFRTLQHDSTTGSSVWRDNGQIDFQNTTFNNTGILDITGGGRLFDDGGTNLFDNSGTVTVNSTGTVQVEVPFNNNNTVDGQAGTIDFEVSTVSPGDFSVSSAAAIDFAGGIHDLTAADLTGLGTIRFSGGTTTIDDGGGGAAFSVGTAQFTGGIANINIDADADTLILTTGTLTNNANTPTFTVNNQFDWNANATMSGTGITEVVPAASMDISSISTRDLFRTLQHDSTTGSSVWQNNGQIDFQNTTFNNTGILDITGGGRMFDDGGTNLFDNTGTVTVNSSGTVQVEIPFNNNNTLDGQAGTIDFEVSTVSPGDFSVSSAAAIDFAGGTHDLTDADLTGLGTIRFSGGTTTIDDGGGGAAFSVGTAQFTGGIANINIDADADTLILTTGTLTNNANTPTFTVNNQFDWNANATMSGTGITEVVPTASMDISSISTRDLFRTLQHDSTTGSSVWRDNGQIDFQNTTFNNTGILDITGGGRMFDDGGTNLFDNSGTLTGNSSGTTQIEVPFTTSDTVDVQSGNLRFEVSYTQSAGTTLLSGGTLVGFGGTSLDFDGGTLEGGGTISGTVNMNAGSTLSAGTSLDTINVTDIVFDGGSFFDVELGAGLVSDVVAASNNVTINPGATMNILQDAGYTGGAGDLFAVLTAGGTFAGTFDTVVQPTDFAVNPVYTLGAGGDLTLDVTGVFNRWLDASADWRATTTNWSLGLFPNAGHIVVFDTGGITVTHNSVDPESIAGLQLDATSTLAWNLGSLDIAANSTLDGNLQVSGGSVQATGTGDLTVGGLLTWDNTSAIGGGGGSVFANGGLAIGGGAGTLTLDGVVTIGGGPAATWINSSAIQTTIVNGGSGSIVNNGGIVDDRNVNGIIEVQVPFTNQAGTVQKSVGGANLVFSNTFDNTGGTLDAQTDVIELNFGGTLSAGVLDASGGSIDFGGNVFDMTGGTVQGAAGFIATSAGIVNVDPGTSYDIGGQTRVLGGQMNFNVAATTGTVQVSGGDLSGGTSLTASGPTTWNNTSTISVAALNADGGLSIGGGAGTLTLDGVVTIGGGPAATWNNSSATQTTIVNGGGGSIVNNGGIVDDRNFNGIIEVQVPFTNQAGTVQKSLGGANLVFSNTFDNTGGTLDAQTDVIELNFGGTHTAGVFDASGGTIDFGGVTHTMTGGTVQGAAGTVLTSAGTVNVNAATAYGLGGLTQVTGGQINFNVAATTGTTRVSGGDLSGGTSLTASGLTTWEGTSTISVAALNADGGFSVDGSAGTLTLDGVVTIGGGPAALWENSSATQTTVVNGGGGSIVNNGGIVDDRNFNGIIEVQVPFTNQAGTVQKSLGGANLVFSNTFDNTGGTLDAQTDVIELNFGGTHTAGVFDASGGTIDFGGVTHTMTGGTVQGAAGTVLTSAGTVNVNAATAYGLGGLTQVTGGQINFNVAATTGTTRVSGGDLSGGTSLTASGLTTWEGTSTISVSALNADGGFSVDGSAGTLTLDGVVTIGGGPAALWENSSATQTTVVDGGGGSIVNNGGIVDDRNFNGIIEVQVPFTNQAGTVQKSLGGANLVFSNTFDNTGGTLDAQTDVIELNFGGTHTAGVFDASGGTIDFGGVTHTMTGGTVQGAAGTVLTSAGTVNVNAATAYGLGGLTQVTGGQINFNVAATTGTTRVSGGDLSGGTSLTASGLTTWEGTSTISVSALNADGGFSVDGSAGTLTLDGVVTIGGGPAALWENSSATQTTVVDGGGGSIVNNGGIVDDRNFNGIIEVQVPFTNQAGTVQKSLGGGNLVFSNTFDNTGGTVDAQTDTIQFDGSFDQTAGITVLNGGGITNSVPLNISGGTLQGAGTIVGDVVASTGGTVSTGASIGTMNVTNVTFDAGSFFDVELGPGLTNDLLAASSNVTINPGATVNVLEDGGYTGTVGEMFTVLTAGGTFTGTFDTVNAPTNFGVSAQYPGSSLRLDVSGLNNIWTDASADWRNAAVFWSRGVFPNATHIVVIDSPGDIITHFTGNSETIAGLEVSAGTTLQLASGRIDVNTDSIIEGDFIQSAGSLGGASTLTFQGNVDWRAGVQDGGGVTHIDPLGSLTLSTGGTKTLFDRTLDHDNTTVGAGESVWSGGVISLSDATAVFDHSGELFIRGDNTISGAGRLDSTGTITKEVSVGTTFFNADFNNIGIGATLNVDSGTLSINGGGASNRVIDATGQALIFAGAYTLQSGSSTVADTVAFTGGAVDFEAGSTYDASTSTGVSTPVDFQAGSTILGFGSSLNIIGGSLNLDTGSTQSVDNYTHTVGTLSGSDPFTVNVDAQWSAGSITGSGGTLFSIPDGVALTLSTGGTKTLFDRTLDHDNTTVGAGESVWSGGTISLLDANAVFDHSGELFVRGDNSIINAGRLDSTGTITKEVGVGTTAFGADFNNKIGATLNVNSGTISISGGGESFSSIDVSGQALIFAGAYTLRSGSSTVADTVAFTGGAVDFESGSTYDASTSTGVGAPVDFQAGSAIVGFGPSLNITGGSLNLDTGSAQSVDNYTQTGGTLSGSDPFTVNVDAQWSAGSITGSGGTLFSIPDGVALALSTGGTKTLFDRTLDHDNTTVGAGESVWSGGTISLLDANAVFDHSGELFIRGNDTIIGTGRVDSTGTITKEVGAGTTTFNADFNNIAGIVAATSGLTSFGGGFTQSGGETRLAGGDIAATPVMTYEGGTITGDGTITADITDPGTGTGLTIAPGASVGTINIDGDLVLDVGSSIDVEFENGASHDVISVTGNVTLAGALNATDAGTDAGSFPFMDCAGGAGCMGFGATDFDVFNLDSTFTATPVKNSTDYTLTVTGVSNFWDLDATGDWEIGGNWSRGVIPQINHLAIIDDVGIIVTHGVGNDTIAALNLIGGTTLDLSGGSLILQGSSTVDGDILVGTLLDFAGGSSNVSASGSLIGNGEVKVSNASTLTVDAAATYDLGTTTITGGAGATINSSQTDFLTLDAGNLAVSGTFTVNTQFDWIGAGGLIDGGGTVELDGVTNLNANAAMLVDTVTFDNAGSVFYAPAGGALVLDNGAKVINQATAVFELQGGDTIFNGNGASLFDNSGDVLKSGGGLTSTIQGAFTNSSTGLIDVDSGTVQLTATGGFNNQGTVDIDGTDFFVLSGPFTNAGTGIITGNGTIGVPGLLTNDGRILPGPGIGTLTISGGNLVLGPTSQIRVRRWRARLRRPRRPGATLVTLGDTALNGSVQLDGLYRNEGDAEPWGVQVGDVSGDDWDTGHGVRGSVVCGGLCGGGGCGARGGDAGRAGGGAGGVCEGFGDGEGGRARGEVEALEAGGVVVRGRRGGDAVVFIGGVGDAR